MVDIQAGIRRRQPLQKLAKQWQRREGMFTLERGQQNFELVCVSDSI